LFDLNKLAYQNEHIFLHDFHACAYVEVNTTAEQGVAGQKMAD
jgi:hypothetical protein